MLVICFHVQASDNTTMTKVDRRNAPNHQDHISAENREPRTRSILYWEVESCKTRRSTLSSSPSESGLWDYSRAHVKQFLTCLKHIWNTGAPILLNQWWVAGCTQTMDIGRKSQISPNSLWGLHRLQHSPIKTTVLRAVLTCQSFQQRNHAAFEKQVSTHWRRTI